MDDFALVASLAALTSQSAVIDAVLARTRPLGLNTLVAARLPSPDHPYPDDFLVSTWPQEWNQLYYEREFGPDDPVGRAAAMSDRPMTLAQIVAGEAGFAVTAKGHEMLAAAAAFGRPQCILVPVFGAHGYRGIVCFAGDGPDPSPRDMALLSALGTAAHHRLREFYLAGHADPDRAALTAREKAILRAIQSGDRDEAVARSLRISVRTVRFHVSNVRRKLGVRTRSEALTRAVALHLI